MKIYILFLLLFVSKLVSSQSFVFDLNKKLYDNQYPIFLHAHSDSFIKYSESQPNHFKITSKIGNYFSVWTSNAEIKKLRFQKWVYQIEDGGKKIFALSDSVRIHSNIDSVYFGNFPLTQPYKGDSVIVGIVDFGMEWRHRDFQHADSTSRILFFWNQNKDSVFPNGFNYGMEWKKSHFDANTCNHIETLSVHGTNSAGNAAGNGTMNPNYRGVAPKADIISVSIKNNANAINNIVDGIRYIFNKADSLNKPCVINVSIGTYDGSHDGMDIASLMVDSLVKAKKGRAVVFAAGNAAHIPHHIQMNPTLNDTFFTDFTRTPSWGGTYFKFWSDTQDFKDLKIGIRADTLVTLAPKSQFYSYNLKSQFFDSVMSKGFYQIDMPCIGFLGDTLGIIQIYCEKEMGGIRTEIFIQTSKTNLLWRFAAFGGGKLDMWVNSGLQTTSNPLISPLPSVSVCPEIGKYKIPDNDISICSGFQCSPHIISVGNYVNKEGVIDVDTIYRYIGGKRGEIASSSSKGPTRKGLMKPEISAPGGGTFAAVDFNTRASFLISNRRKLDVSSYYSVNGGTSMSAPIVAGAIALIFQKDKNLSHSEIAYLIKKNARRDSFSSFVENNTYGSGKLNVFQTLNYNYRFGCKLDTSAFNYDSTIDFHRQDSCIPKVYGCTDTASINYNSLANIDNGTCIKKRYGIMDTACINYDSLANVSGGICIPKVYGCTDTASINYNPLANIDNGTCIAKRYGIMDTACINYDSLANVSGGICIPKVYGCTDTGSINYNSLANVDNGTCIKKRYGIMDTACINYNSLANVSGGVCIPKVYGCTDTASINYNSLANIDNGTCIKKRYGIMDTACINYDSLANVSGGICIAKIYGCTDTASINYNPLANVDNGSCIKKRYGIMDTACINYDSLANVSGGVCIAKVYGCTDTASINYNSLANIDNGTCIKKRYGIMDTACINYDSLANVSGGVCIPKVYGCTDTLAINYNPLANVNDGSCRYKGVNIQELEFSKISFYPNPASTSITFENKNNHPIYIEIRNLYVQLIKKILVDEKLTLDVSNWARGVYFIQVVDNEFNSTKKLILK